MGIKVRAKVTSKGQVTVPKAVRDALGLDASSVVEFELKDGGAVMTPAANVPLLRWVGSVEPRQRPEDWKAIKEETRRGMGRRAAQKGL